MRIIGICNIIILEGGNIYNLISDLINNSTQIVLNGGILFGIIIIIMESFLPILPLWVFITLNVNAFGFLPGVIISWISTCIGCYISYSFFYYLSSKVKLKCFRKSFQKRIEKGKTSFHNLSFSELVIIITLPFTPAFLINILAGITGISKKKFVASIVIGKLFMVLFWAYIGKSLIESMTDIGAIITISIMLVIAYIISKIVGRKAHIE